MKDKVYMLAQEVEIPSENFVGMAFTRLLEGFTSIEYVRKDALLEWANGELMPGNSAEGKGWNLALQTLIAKLNSM